MDPKSIQILDNPRDFKAHLQSRMKTASHSFLNCLYISDEELGILKGNKVEIGVDYYRGTRNSQCSNSNFYFWKSPNYSLISQYLPRRWNETLGTFHIKGFIIDDQVILAGANLSRDYFDNRQDRYIIFNCKDLARFYRNLFKEIHCTSWTIGENGEFTPPKRGYEYLQKVALNLQEMQEENSVLKRLESETTFIVPTLQMGALGIRQEEKMLSWIFNLVGSQGRKGWLSSAYLNIPNVLFRIIKDSRIKLDLLTSSPECNGFYGANNVSKYIPDAYSYLEYQLLNSSLKDQISIHEYSRPGWTFHAKGFWSSFAFKGSEWTVCTIGSSNFNSRSLNTDLESQAFLFTKDPSLSMELEKNRMDLFKYASVVSMTDLRRRNIKPLVKLAARLVRPWL